jgi:GNAT superfamily N-acetyltransferase
VVAEPFCRNAIAPIVPKVMLEAANYSVVEELRNGLKVTIRALKPEDQAGLLDAVRRTSDRSLYRRFFGAKRVFSEAEIAYFSEFDFVNHVALISVVDDGSRARIVGGGRYVVVQPRTAEVAFAVVDKYQGQGIGSRLMRHLIALARDAGLEELIAEVLPDNISMLRVFQNSGLGLSSKRAAGVVHVALQLQ